MAKYIGPKTKIARKFGEKIFGKDKYFDRKKYIYNQHGSYHRRGKKSGYALQLLEKQKLKYIYGVLERQCRRMFKKALSMKQNTGEVFLQLFESRLDNVVYRLGISLSRSGARQLVLHGHITVNQKKVNIPSYLLKPGDIVEIRNKSQNHQNIQHVLNSQNSSGQIVDWLGWDQEKMRGTFKSLPERENIPENINERIIVEWYSKYK
ncbi:MAG: 30S ribosomal protein S4 [Candidatus Walczuchella monophlebidarum]